MVGGRRSYEFARRLVECGHEVRVVTADQETPARNARPVTTEGGITVHWLPVVYDNSMN
jgi:hypothetical protein